VVVPVSIICCANDSCLSSVVARPLHTETSGFHKCGNFDATEERALLSGRTEVGEKWDSPACGTYWLCFKIGRETGAKHNLLLIGEPRSSHSESSSSSNDASHEGLLSGLRGGSATR
jgi:hypothetical protein